MSNIETFDSSVDILDPLYQKNKESIDKMRSALLSCSDENLSAATAKQALKNITSMRIYHQLSRIIRYLELMDKLENKMYASIESTIDKAPDNPSTWMMLVNLQEKLQHTMIESHKLLQPYLDLKEFDVIDLIPQTSDTESNSSSMLPAESRERIRDAANMVLHAITQSEDAEGGSEDGSY